MSLNEIDSAALAYKESVVLLYKKLSWLDDKIAALQAKHAEEIVSLANACISYRDELESLIKENSDLFEKPRTQEFYGVKVGYRAGAAKLIFETSEEHSCAQIHKKLPELKAALIKTTEKPIAAALKNLNEKQQKAIGIYVQEPSDAVVIKPVDSAMEKRVSATISNLMSENI